MTAHTNALTLIVAADAHHGIGYCNRLPWHLPEDLRHFKQLTWGHTLIMGRKTFESIGRVLPGRRSIVVTGNSHWQHPQVDVAHSLEAAIQLSTPHSPFLIGGAQLYTTALAENRVDRILLTRIHHPFTCDTFFPPLDEHRWQVYAMQSYTAHNGLAFSFIEYQKRL